MIINHLERFACRIRRVVSGLRTLPRVHYAAVGSRFPFNW